MLSAADVLAARNTQAETTATSKTAAEAESKTFSNDADMAYDERAKISFTTTDKSVIEESADNRDAASLV